MFFIEDFSFYLKRHTTYHSTQCVTLVEDIISLETLRMTKYHLADGL